MACRRPLISIARNFTTLLATGGKASSSNNSLIHLQRSAMSFFNKKKSFVEEKEKFLNMPLEEKRNHYQKSKFFTLEEIKNWQQMAEEELLETDIEPKYAFDQELNEKVSIWEGDITTLEIDVVVNAANKGLWGGGGVCGAIFSAASSRLEEECQFLKPCNPGNAKMTGGYKMPARYILHAVGPTDGEADVLEKCYTTCFEFFKKRDNMPDVRSMAFPCIATGIYGFLNWKAAEIAVCAAREFLEDNRDNVDRIIFCLFTEEDKKLYRENMLVYFPIEEQKQEEN